MFSLNFLKPPYALGASNFSSFHLQWSKIVRIYGISPHFTDSWRQSAAKYNSFFVAFPSVKLSLANGLPIVNVCIVRSCVNLSAFFNILSIHPAFSQFLLSTLEKLCVNLSFVGILSCAFALLLFRVWGGNLVRNRTLYIPRFWNYIQNSSFFVSSLEYSL